jgi:hypothetical protein
MSENRTPPTGASLRKPTLFVRLNRSYCKCALSSGAKAPRKLIGSAEVIRRILACRGLRALGDGLVAILLPIRLEQLGYGPVRIGAIATSALLGSALLTILLGFMGHRLRLRRMLLSWPARGWPLPIWSRLGC